MVFSKIAISLKYQAYSIHRIITYTHILIDILSLVTLLIIEVILKMQGLYLVLQIIFEIITHI